MRVQEKIHLKIKWLKIKVKKKLNVYLCFIIAKIMIKIIYFPLLRYKS